MIPTGALPALFEVGRAACIKNLRKFTKMKKDKRTHLKIRECKIKHFFVSDLIDSAEELLHSEIHDPGIAFIAQHGVSLPCSSGTVGKYCKCLWEIYFKIQHNLILKYPKRKKELLIHFH